MFNRNRAEGGEGLCFELCDENGRASFFYKFTRDEIDNPGKIASQVLRDVAVWLAEGGYLPSSDGSPMVLGG